MSAALCGVAALGAADPVSGDCLEQPAVYHYLERAQEEILDHWELPPDGLANRAVVVRFSFESDGSLRRARIVSATDHRLKRSVAAAIARAAPFRPVPAGASCLVGLSIQTTFRNPAD